MQLGSPRSRAIGLGASVLGGLLLSAVGAGYLWGRSGIEHDRALREPAKMGETQLVRMNEPALNAPHGHDHPHDHPHDDDAPASPGNSPTDAPEPSPEEARAREIRRIETSGPDSRNLLSAARRVGEDWSKMAAAQDLEVSFDEWRCYRGGCLVNALHSATGVLDRVTNEITHTRGFLDWNGEKLRTGPVQSEDGKTEVTWILFAPREGEQALNDPIPTPERKRP